MDVPGSEEISSYPYNSSFKSNCLKGKVAFVTGGGSGIGRGITQRLMEMGCNAVIVSRNGEKLSAAAKSLEALTGRHCLPFSADVRDYESMGSAFDAALSRFHRIDILVNCAAGNFLCPLEHLSYKGFKTVMEIDAHGTFIASHLAFCKAFKHQQQGGVIVNISMTLHYCGSLLQAHAGAAKAAVDALTKHMCVEWGPYNVRVNGVAPGPIAGTEGMKKLVPAAEEKPEQQTSSSSTSGSPSSASSAVPAPPPLEMLVPLQRLGTVRDVADCVVFLCLPEASYISGTTVVVDGGQWLTSCNFTALHPATREMWLDTAKDTRERNSAGKGGEVRQLEGILRESNKSKL